LPLGGVVLAFSFFLTVSWPTRPYYFGADIVFVFAWTPLLIAGDAGVLSLTARLRAKVRRKLGLPAHTTPDEGVVVQDDVELCSVLRGGLIPPSGHLDHDLDIPDAPFRRASPSAISPIRPAASHRWCSAPASR
jgi:hypothetical protein